MIQLPTSLSEEIDELRKTYPKVIIHTFTPSFLTASYQRTPYTRIKFTLTFPEGYPDHPLIVDIKQDEVVPPGLKRKLEQELLVTDILPLGHYQQVVTVVTKLVQFVNNNKFLPCWKELKQVVNLIQRNDEKDAATSSTNDAGSTISVVESKGRINLKLCRKKYYYHCTITVDDGYPSTMTHEDWGKACTLKVISTNFPPNIEHMLTSQAIEIVRRMQDGMTAEKAMILSNPIRKPRTDTSDHQSRGGSTDTASDDRYLSRDQLKHIKHDIDTLSNVRDLRAKDAEKVQGKSHILKQHTKEQKAARRAIHRITDKELAADRALLEEQQQQQEEEKARLAGYYTNMSHFDYFPPQPSLLSLVIFLKEKIQMLPDVKCPCCQSPAFPSDPTLLEAMYSSSQRTTTTTKSSSSSSSSSSSCAPSSLLKRKQAKAMRPMRCYCGCWYHYKCLDKYMTEPPFGASCPTKGCKRQVFHPNWPSDRKQLEREWAGHQARLREIQDAAMFL
jgi:hypothetical protein